MFEDVDSLKSFILWCKEQKIQEVKVDNVIVMFSPMNFVPEIDGSIEDNLLANTTRDLSTPPNLKHTAPTEDDPDLYWSSN